MTKELPDMPEVDPDDGDIERHDAHYRLNPSGHKELVIQKKGEQDEETLNELAESLMEMAGDYEGLEDDDEFEDEPEDDYEYCDYCDRFKEEECQNCGRSLCDVHAGEHYDFCGSDEEEDEYEGLEDADEFKEGESSWQAFQPDQERPTRHVVIFYGNQGIPDDEVLVAAGNELGVQLRQVDIEDEPASTWNVPFNLGYFWAEMDSELPYGTTASGHAPNGEWIAVVESPEDEYEGLEDADEFGRRSDDCEYCGGTGEIISSLYEDDVLVSCPQCSDPDDLQEDIAFGGPAPAMSPEQQGYQRDFRPQTPAAYVDTGPVQVSSDHETERAAQESPNNFTSTTAQAADGPEMSRAKSRIRSSTIRGTGSRNKYISGTRGDGLDYGATHSESFTGTAAIAIGTYDVLGNEKNEDTDTSESLMANRNLLNEWEPKFAGGGDYDPGDYQMPSPTGDGVAERKPKKSKVGAYDTATSNQGKEWPRDHNETAAMCDVDDDGVEHKPQGGHESSVGEPKDGHQSELGHNWPDQPKLSGSGVAEPFEGNRWSDGGTLSGGKGADDEHFKAGGPGMPGTGTITGTSGPQNGQPQEGRWSPDAFATLMEGDIDIQALFDAYAADGREAVCVEDFEMLLRAHGCGVQIDEQSLMYLMKENRQFIFYEGVDANGPYWVPTPIAEGKPFPGAAPPFGSKDSDSDDDDDGGSDSDNDDDDDGGGGGKPFKGAAPPFGKKNSNSDSDDDSDDDDSGKPWESRRRRGRVVSEGSGWCDKCKCPASECGCDEEECEEDCVEEGSLRRPFSLTEGRTLSEFQRRSPEEEANLYQSGITDDPTMIPPGLQGPGTISASPLDDIPGDDFEPGLPGEFDMADPLGDEDDFGPGPDFGGPGAFGMHNASTEACPECGYEGPGGEETCPECGAMMGGMGEEDIFGPGGMEPRGGLPSDIDDEDEYFSGGGGYDDLEESKMYSPQIQESLRRFMVSARNIIGRNRGQHVGAIAEALNSSWDYHAGNVNANRCPTKVQQSLSELMDKFPGFSPVTEEFSDRPEAKAMNKADGSPIGGGGGANNKSSFLPESDTDTKDEGEAWPRSHRQQNSPEETPIIKGTEKGMSGTGGNAKTVKENVARLSRVVRKCLAEGVKGLQGKFDVRFTCLVQEDDGSFNRTPARIRLAEALADAEELLQIHAADQVVLESYFGRNGQCLRKYNIPLTPVKVRGPLVSGDMALFRFNRSAEQYAENLVSEGITCRIGSHNWGRAVQVLSEKKKWMQDVKATGECTPMTKSTCTGRKKAFAKRVHKGGDLYQGGKKHKSTDEARRRRSPAIT